MQILFHGPPYCKIVEFSHAVKSKGHRPISPKMHDLEFSRHKTSNTFRRIFWCKRSMLKMYVINKTSNLNKLYCFDAVILINKNFKMTYFICNYFLRCICIRCSLFLTLSLNTCPNVKTNLPFGIFSDRVLWRIQVKPNRFPTKIRSLMVFFHKTHNPLRCLCVRAH